MNVQSKLISIMVVLCTLSCSCGDIIKARNPTKKMNTPEPEEKTSALYGRCANFQGHWTSLCLVSQAEYPSSFFVSQLYCDLFAVLYPERSFENLAVSWSDSRDLVSLKSDIETITLTKRNGIREGTWNRGGQECSLRWAP